VRLFLYGTLLDPTTFAGIAGRDLPRTPAVLPGWRRVALPGGRYPTLRRGRVSVAGVIVAVDAVALARLSAYEGPAYRLTPVVVRTARGNTLAHAWIAPGGTDRDWS
jgi:gamma-glutamylcyclotransferase (GGCT)/AIG2-like uncharacterized protein YtfP